MTFDTTDARAGAACLNCLDPILGTAYSHGHKAPLCYPCVRSAKAGGRVKSDGGSTAYYRLPEHATELRHLISYKGMSKSRGDVFKACYRLGEKEGSDILYDLKKMKFFVDDLIEMYGRGESV